MVQCNSTGGADEGAVAVFALGVGAVQETLGDDRPLDGNVLHIAVGGERFVDRPGGRDVVDDDAVGGGDDAKRIAFDFVAVTEPDAQVANDDVVGGDDEGLAEGQGSC